MITQQLYYYWNIIKIRKQIPFPFFPYEHNFWPNSNYLWCHLKPHSFVFKKSREERSQQFPILCNNFEQYGVREASFAYFLHSNLGNRLIEMVCAPLGENTVPYRTKRFNLEDDDRSVHRMKIWPRIGRKIGNHQTNGIYSTETIGWSDICNKILNLEKKKKGGNNLFAHIIIYNV